MSRGTVYVIMGTEVLLPTQVTIITCIREGSLMAHSCTTTTSAPELCTVWSGEFCVLREPEEGRGRGWFDSCLKI